MLHAKRSAAAQMLDQTQAALFLVDGRAGIASQDYDVAKWLRSTYKQPIILLCSKVDHLGNNQLMANVHEATCLGLGEAIAVSAGMLSASHLLQRSATCCLWNCGGLYSIDSRNRSRQVCMIRHCFMVWPSHSDPGCCCCCCAKDRPQAPVHGLDVYSVADRTDPATSAVACPFSERTHAVCT
jgi:hypothetical protein